MSFLRCTFLYRQSTAPYQRRFLFRSLEKHAKSSGIIGKYPHLLMAELAVGESNGTVERAGPLF